MRILVTGGAGFIGSALIRRLVADGEHAVVNLDKLTYAADLRSLESAESSSRYAFVQADVADVAAVAEAFRIHQPDALIHLAAESHVDRSISGAAPFVATNLTGTFVMLEAALAHWRGLSGEAKARFRFLHVSTDEVFGSLGETGVFDETTAYDPRSPYSATKAGADHLVKAWGHTYGLPMLVSNCSNNYGPYQFPEKLIPLTVLNALEGQPLPVYGDGGAVRDWLHVDDHVDALLAMLIQGEPGRTYAVGGRAERTTLQVVEGVCEALQALRPSATSYRDLITLVPDRPGHDRRYAVDPSRIEAELGWRARHDFAAGLAETVAWYVTRRDWWEPLRARYAGERLGLVKAG